MKTLGDILKDVKSSIKKENKVSNPIISIDKNEDGLVITKSSGDQTVINLGSFNTDMAELYKGDKGDQGERGLSVKGDRGEPGRAGNSIINVKFDQRGHLIIETVEKTYDLGLLRSGGGGISTQNVSSLINTTPTYAYPEITSFKITPFAEKYEIGEVIAANNYTVIFDVSNSKNVKAGGYTLTDITNDNKVLASGIESSPYNVYTSSLSLAIESFFTLDESGYYTFELSNYNTKGEIFSQIFEIPFVDSYYYGESTKTSITNTDVRSFKNKLSEVERPTNYTDFDYNESPGAYKWLCIPARFGSQYFFEDPTTGIQFLMEAMGSLQITNSFGIVTPYNTYRSVNTITGQIRLRAY